LSWPLEPRRWCRARPTSPLRPPARALARPGE
jgi:hypothetical protein